MRNKKSITELIRATLVEDIGPGDFTTEAVVDINMPGRACIIAKEDGVLAGLEIVKQTFSSLDKDAQFESYYKDGDRLKKKETIIKIDSTVSNILKAERTALNFLAHLSGIATLTSKFVKKIQGTSAKIADTRKTTPLIRQLEKEAVLSGGGINHRMGLFDMILIKENHIEAAGGIQNAVSACRQFILKNNLNIRIEVETTNLSEVSEAVSCKVDQIMLDNMDLKTMKDAVELISGRSIVEASGGVSLETIRSIAETGVDLISVGALTHSAPAMDFSLLLTGK